MLRQRRQPCAKTFEKAYDLAMQLIELREKPGASLKHNSPSRCGIDQGDISRIERGSTSPTTRTLQRIAEALDAEVRLIPRAS